MKALLRPFLAGSVAYRLKNLGLLMLFLAFYVAVLFFLMNSPA